MQNKVALIIVFNHRYDKNIPLLESIYEDRFSNIYYLVPFYDGDRKNVIPVYESSFQFQGYMAQGLKHYFREEYEHYLFVADDLLLHPAMDETNYKEYFGLNSNTSFIPELFPLHDLPNNETIRFIPSNKKEGQKKKWYWWRLKQLINYKHGSEGTETGSEMPSYQEAEAIINKHGYFPKPLSAQDVFGSYLSFADTRNVKEAVKYVLNRLKYRKGFNLPYPMVGSYSDIVIVAKPAIKKFAHYCGVFAANRLFVEFAIPTALLLSSLKVMTEPELGKRGLIYWGYTKREADNYANALKPYNNNLV
ncbi:MAG TPA: hypothetical protein VER36_07235, partial [Flavisolibacter sp.]|nr:hypothetical protein [Flavisolibacter sp.]